jgi:hypothetical protein
MIWYDIAEANDIVLWYGMISQRLMIWCYDIPNTNDIVLWYGMTSQRLMILCYDMEWYPKG